MNGEKTILICDENITIHQVLQVYFHKEKFQTLSAYDCNSVLKILRSNLVDLIVLDIAMQNMLGKDLCAQIRAEFDTPILILSAHADEDERIAGLELGADDFVAKPFYPREVVLRIRRIMNRANRAEKEESLQLGNLRIEQGSGLAFVGEQQLSLTHIEQELLAFLISHSGEVVSREKILHGVWGQDAWVSIRTVDTVIARIRTKIPCAEAGISFRSVYGVGYMLAEVADKIDPESKGGGSDSDQNPDE